MSDDIQNESLTPAVAPQPADVPPIVVTREGGDTSTSTSRTPGPGELDAINRAEGAGLAGVAYQEKADEEQQKADVAAQPEEDYAAALKQQQAQQTGLDLQHFQDLTNKAQASKAAADEQLGGVNPQFHNLLQNESTAKKVAQAIGLGLTGLSGNVEAQKAQFQSLDNMIKNDFNVQRENYNAKLNYAKQKGEDVNDIYKQYEQYQGFSHAAEQKTNEAVLAHMVAEAKKRGIPAEVALRSAAAQAVIRNIEQSKANSLGAFTRVHQTTRQLEPTTTTTEGKIQGGKGGKPAAPVANVDSADLDFLAKNPPTPRAKDAARRMLTNDPGLLDKAKGLISGGSLPDYLARLSPDERAQAEAIARVTPPLAEVTTNNKRAGTNKEMLAATLESHIPSADDTPESRKRKLDNLNKATGRVGAAQQGVTPSQPKAPEPMVTIKNKKTGETKQVTRQQAIAMGAISG